MNVGDFLVERLSAWGLTPSSLVLVPSGERIADEARLRQMKRSAFLINTARGPVVDGAALEQALREGWIAGAALDVTDPEPLPGGHPLLGAPGLLVVPHIGSATATTRLKMARMAVANLLAGLEGRPLPHSVNARALGPPSGSDAVTVRVEKKGTSYVVTNVTIG